MAKRKGGKSHTEEGYPLLQEGEELGKEWKEKEAGNLRQQKGGGKVVRKKKGERKGKDESSISLKIKHLQGPGKTLILRELT